MIFDPNVFGGPPFDLGTQSLGVDVSKWDTSFTIPTVATITNVSHTVSPISTLMGEEGGVEWEITLAKKPSTNTVSVPFQSSNLVFFYQPPLTQEFNQADCEIWTENYVKLKRGGQVWRPENVVGSYAVYHSSKRNNEYKTGKAFHIYRPQLKDALQNTAWATMNIAGNVLTITLPQTFLDAATYPVTVDPTFGKATIGANQWTYGGNEAMWACRFTMPEAGDITLITAYVRAYAGTQGSKTVIYADSSGNPAGRLALSNDVTLDATFAWKNYTVSYSGVNTDYHLTFACNDGGQIMYDTGGGTNQESHRIIPDYTNPPNPFGTPGGQNPYIISIYATYTVAGGLSIPVAMHHYNQMRRTRISD
jgi:hypothetical protein